VLFKAKIGKYRGLVIMDEEAIVTYVDTTIFQSDLDVLDPGCWLNDKIIGFYFEYVFFSHLTPVEKTIFRQMHPGVLPCIFPDVN
jgi:hypothetical protein